MARLQSLVEFINVIKADSESLKKFPRIITKCYETNSKICQEVCEVYSDDMFQTVNIKKMCKLKPCVSKSLKNSHIQLCNFFLQNLTFFE